MFKLVKSEKNLRTVIEGAVTEPSQIAEFEISKVKTIFLAPEIPSLKSQRIFNYFTEFIDMLKYIFQSSEKFLL